MIKKILVVLLSVLALTACSGRKAAKVDFQGPTSGPDFKKIMPSYGPNDPVPVPTTDGGPNG